MLTCLAVAFCLNAAAQEISLEKGWKFSTGDSEQWASPGFDDSGWKPINVQHSWEQQGYEHYDGFGWYRLHVVIPSSLKEKAYLKDSLHIDLGVIDDNDEVYLNGKLIAKYGGKGGSIKASNYGPRNYVIAANNPAILWDKENVLAVRVFDTGGDGGMYGDKHAISMADLLDNVSINTDADFTFGDKNSLSKAIKLKSTGSYLYKGKLDFKVVDPENGNIMYQKTNDVDFTLGKPFTYNFSVAEMGKKSYYIVYTFTEEKSGKPSAKQKARLMC